MPLDAATLLAVAGSWLAAKLSRATEPRFGVLEFLGVSFAYNGLDNVDVAEDVDVLTLLRLELL